MPAAYHADRGADLAQRAGEPAALPELVAGRVVHQPVLPVPYRAAGGQPVEVAQREVPEQRPPAPLRQPVPYGPQRPLLAVDLAHPVKGCLQGERPAGVERGTEVGAGDLDGDCLEVRSRVRRDRPLGHAQVTRAAGAERAGVPRLLTQPGRRGQAVVVLVGPERVKRAAGAEGAAATLDHGLETTLGEQPAEQQSPRSAPSIGRPDQHERWPVLAPRNVAVGQQHNPVWHGTPQVTLDYDIAGRGRRQLERLLHETAGESHV